MKPQTAESRRAAADAGQTRVNSAAIRRLNTARVFHALREHPNSSQRALGQITGLDAATVSSIVARLEVEGILQRSIARRSGQAGRPESLLSIGPEAGLLIGAGLEPDGICLIAAGLDGTRRIRLDLPGARDPAEAVAALQRGVTELLIRCAMPIARLRGIGIGVPGLLDSRGQLVLAPNLGWRDLPLAAMLRAAFGDWAISR